MSNGMDTFPPIIGLYSPVPQSGKTSVAEMLREHLYIRRAFAAPLKEMTGTLLRHLYGSSLLLEDKDKETQWPGFNSLVTTRRVLQTLGTEWGRDLISPTIWVNAAMNTLDRGGRYVFDDLRFPNEYEEIKRRGGVCWHISRAANAKITTLHRSEGALVGKQFDAYIENDGTLKELSEIVNDILGV